MKSTRALALSILIIGSVARAGPVEEVQEVVKQRGQAYEAGNIDGYMANWADNAVFTPSRLAYRFEGKDAIRAVYAGIFQNTQSRKVFAHHTMYRAFGDNVVIANGYQDVVWVDKAGSVTSFNTRNSAVWIKVNGKWLTADYHLSKGP